MVDPFSTPDFEAAYTYDGQDLGATWTPEKTSFRLWAPTADAANVLIYRSGTPGAMDLSEVLPLKRDRLGTWTADKAGDLNGVFYTYQVRIGTYIAEACDPYARATGINGQRAMVIDLKSTDPKGWDKDSNPNPLIQATDAVIYELHVRDLSIDASSGIRNKGKFLGVIETGTTTPSGIPTGLDHIKSLGITHLHLLPVYDFGSVDEAHPEIPQFNWGYDPVNFNVPEGSYASDAADGAVRVKEMKQMVKGLHDNGISVVMDVVYNHVYDAASFCFNKLVPLYFSRVTDGVYSNGSGCGNDTASERSMVRKYIVDSICYWAEEYHIDGFRFDLVGLLDVDTINAIVTAVHKKHPHVIFYGEGWSLDTHTTKPCQLAVQANCSLTPNFAYFNDTIRDTLRGSVFYSDELGYLTGATGIGDKLESCFRGMPFWCSDPTQVVNYVSCHDNNTLLDRLALAAPEADLKTLARMCRLAAAFCLTAQGIPFFQAGEEMLRTKPDGKGGFVENSYNAPDSVNAIKWSCLELEECRLTRDYYKGLIAFRKAHPALRMDSSYDILSNVVPFHYDSPHTGGFCIRGDVYYEPSDEIFLVFSADHEPVTVPLPKGKWELCIDDTHAGTASLGTYSGTVTVPPISALVFVRGQLESDLDK